MRNRDISLIVIGLFFGAIIGGVFGNLISWALPEGVVKDFFLTSFSFNVGGGTGNQNGVIIVDLSILVFKFGLEIDFNFTSIVGLATSYYILRYFR